MLSFSSTGGISDSEETHLLVTQRVSKH